MSNYIRTLLRFEKERAARRAAEEESSEVDPRLSEAKGEGGAARSGFWTTAPSSSSEGVEEESRRAGGAAPRGAFGSGPSVKAPIKVPTAAPKDVPIDVPIDVPVDLPFELPREWAANPPRPEIAEAAKAPSLDVQWWPEPVETPTARSQREGRLQGLLSRLPFWERRRRQLASRASTHTSTAYAQLLDSLRAVETSFSAPGVVIASAGSAAAVAPVLEGLQAEARRKGLRLLLAELVVSKGGRVLAGNDPACTAELLEFNRTVTEDTVRNWFERAVTGQDLLIVEAPPLCQSVDAGLLARACDGLALVVEPQHTSRHEFETAVERSKASGSFLLGLVMSHHTHWLPHFLRTFFNSYPRLIRQPPRARSR